MNVEDINNLIYLDLYRALLKNRRKGVIIEGIISLFTSFEIIATGENPLNQHILFYDHICKSSL